MKRLQLLLFTTFSICLLPLTLHAQNEIERERISLEGLQEFGFTANIEGSRTIADDATLTPSAIRQEAINQLVEANLRFVADEEVRSSADIPFLYMHINAMEMENGLIPFSIELRLYQPVKLMLNRDMQTSASTWESGMVGLVSYDQIHVISQAAANLVDTFLTDYQQANNRRASRR
ncbi:hypothetical protein BH23BAC3_BH23BAC3_18530 [soil metagenome]